MHDFAALRRQLVDNQIRPSEVTDRALISAFLSVPRELFVDPAERPFAYSDRDLAYSQATPGRRLMGPVELAQLLDLLPITEDAKVLVIGCGTGYSAAILAHIARVVIAVEEDEHLLATAKQVLPAAGAESVILVRGKLSAGWPEEAPYHAIFLDGAVERVPEAILSQLRPHGALVAVENSERMSRGILYERVGGTISKRPRLEVWAPPLPGFEREKEFVF